jgi:bifunctional non-homologous end joining protein LigD
VPRTSSPTKRSLETYKKKRDFTKTPEPTGTEANKIRAIVGKDLYYCIQKHLASHLHYDLRLEWRGVLLSWAIPKGPSLNPRDKRLAMMTEDHPLDYGDFEGVIPEGYGAGIVMLWDQGTWTPLTDDVDAALKKGELKFELHGVKLKGSWVLVRTRNERTWLLIKHRDQWAGDIDVLSAAPLSVKSFGDFEDILAQENPDVWETHRPASGGVAGTMFKDIIRRAAEKKLEAAEKPKRKAAKRAGKQTKKTARSAKPRSTTGAPKKVRL